LRALLYSFQSLWRWVVKVLFTVFTSNLLDLNISLPSCHNYSRNNAVQVIKKRDEKGRFIGVRVKVVFGDREDVLRLLGRSTSYTERSNLTSRSVQWEAGKEDIGVFKGFGDVSGTCGMGGCVLQSRSSSQGLECLQGWSHQFTTPGDGCWFD